MNGHKSIILANTMLEYFMSRHPNTEDFKIRFYSNKEEQGYHIINDTSPGINRACSFARNPDNLDIKIYVGKKEDFQPEGYIPSKEISRHLSIFKFTERIDISDFLYNWLMKGIILGNSKTLIDF